MRRGQGFGDLIQGWLIGSAMTAAAIALLLNWLAPACPTK